MLIKFFQQFIQQLIFKSRGILYFVRFVSQFVKYTLQFKFKLLNYLKLLE